ncbi:MAG TPA: hypothetical protein VL381_07925 [Rhodocyclaceae bacterium]|nr:hypothetical protein [Rhodocyclaceae bacterium]
MHKWMWILWPSFIVAGIGEGIFFSLINPQELYLLGEPVHYSVIATYSVGFLSFWALCAASSFLTWLLFRPSSEINQL